MEKKELKMYETPQVEVVEMEVSQFLCNSLDVETEEPGGGGVI